MPKKIIAHLALFIVALIYGGNYSIAKIVMDDNYIQPLGFIVMRVLFGMILFSFFHKVFIREKVRREDYGLLFLCGLFGIAINQMFFFMGLKYTTPINASLIMTTTPILVLVISALIIKEKITFLKLLGVALGATGAILLITNGKEVSFGPQQLKGDIMIFINALSYGIYLVIVKKLMLRYHPITVVKWVFTIGLFIVTPFGFNDLLEVEWGSFSEVIWMSVIYVLMGATFLTYMLNAFALKIVNPSAVSIYIYLQPLLATFIALMMKEEELKSVQIYTGVLIFLGVYLVSKPSSRTSK